MWMSLTTSGVKMGLRPRTVRRSGWPGPTLPPTCSYLSVMASQHQLSLGGLQVVVVVELLAADELLELGRLAEPVDPELALDQLRVALVPFPRDAVDPERLHLPGDVDRPVVHGVAEAGADVAAEDLAAALHHEAGHRAGVTERDDRSALLVDAAPSPHAALDEHVAAAQGRPGERAGVAVDDDDPGHHVLARRPADAAGDVDLGPVDQAAAEVAERALEGDAAAREDADAERVLGAGVLHGQVLDPLLVEQPAELQVDLPGREDAGVEDGLLPVDLGDLGDVGMRLCEAARVVGDRPLTYRCHTITSPS